MTGKNLESIKNCRLFTNIPESAYSKVLKYLKARRKEFKKGEFILQIGGEVRAGLVVDGAIECSYQDSDYNKFNMNHFSAGELFGEAMACAEIAASPMQITALTDCIIIFLDFRVLYDSGRGCEYSLQLAGNLMRILSAKNIFLNRKVRLLRITGYLRTLSSHDGVIILPFSKTALAEFLCVNRTALSRELSLMCREGVISMDGRKIVFISEQ